MRRVLMSAFWAVVTAYAVRADVMPAAPIAERVARTATTVVAKVVAVEENKLEQEVYPGAKEKQKYNVATLEVMETLSGPKAKTVKLAFLPQTPRVRFPELDFKPGQEAIFFLTKFGDQVPYRVSMYYDVLPSKGNPMFLKQMDEVKGYAKLLADPDKGLASKDAAVRSLTAMLLVIRYRTIPNAVPEKRIEKAIPAERSMRVLQGLAEADWSKQQFGSLSPRTLFSKLGVTAKDGWKQPADFQQFNDAAKKWLKVNADIYRLKAWELKKD